MARVRNIKPAPRTAVFAEGSHHQDPLTKRYAFDEIWKLLARRSNPAKEIDVFGFSKPQSTILSPPPGLRPSANEQPLDILMKRACDQARVSGHSYDRIIIAVDAHPIHNALSKECRRKEVEKILVGLQNRKILPAPFIEDINRLLLRYKMGPYQLAETGRVERKRRRALSSESAARSRCSIEVLVMEPMFEALLLCDESGLRKALGLSVYPKKDWPSFKRPSKKPDREIFMPACRLATSAVHAKVRDSVIDDKSKWALYILENLDPSSPVWTHPILQRLQLLLS